jgi:Domain of unknown function (DUF4157)
MSDIGKKENTTRALKTNNVARTNRVRLNQDHARIHQVQRSLGNQNLGRLLGSATPQSAHRAASASPDRESRGSQFIHRMAQQGTTGGGTALPFLARIQRAFRRHDISQTRAHQDGRAAAVSRSIGACAYTIGDHVAFADSPDLHTVAHEAAHVVQQRHGVQLVEGVGQAGDAYERHADAVADLVVKRQSASTLLDHIPGGSGGTSPTVGASSLTSQGIQMQRAQQAKPKENTGDPKAMLLQSSFQNMLEKEALKEKLNGAIAHELASAYLASRKARLVSTPYGLKDLNLTTEATHAEVYSALLNAMDITNTKANDAANWNWSPPPSPPKGGTRDKAIVEIENWVGNQLLDEGKDKLRDLAIKEVAVSCAARWTAAEGLVVVAEMVVGALSVVGWIAMATSVLELLIQLQKPVEKTSKAEMIVADVKNWLTFGKRFDELLKASQKAKETKKSLNSYSEDPSNPLAPVYTRSIH